MTCWTRRPEVLWCRTLGAVVVLLPPEVEIDEAVRVVGPGAAVWMLLDRPRTFDQILGLVASEFDVDPDDVRDQVAELIDGLAGRGCLLEVADDD